MHHNLLPGVKKTGKYLFEECRQLYFCAVFQVKKFYILFLAGNLFFPNIFNESVFVGKHITSQNKYCKNGSLFI
ncbi:hypothetical protein DU48_05260 [Methanosarcina mazei]|uniref:Uncharacterized protein n=1 Tax=Methanosarcina mazei TaxID=2209 RepID=A0A0F8HVD3_METMZ|nr:hypothetical protein DU47_12765 [Methanosarcina mazei]KKG13387.1 hypothetical protein DU34_06605 [Methanosarcina mazei]KKG31048.1 hypothetical protein DU49_04310 [Methanosarcina mazei]KKG36926.1 hypothetical protein DU30_12975 [Methanosarcina mazei]KKG38791.1 hypothetical protein DU35_11365 [Methanosarcina mazei]